MSRNSSTIGLRSGGILPPTRSTGNSWRQDATTTGSESRASHDAQLSRRDWFRLRVPKPNRKRLGADESRGMKPIANPPNHDGFDLSELPPLHEAVLTSEQVQALFSDLQNHAQRVQLLARGVSAPNASTTELLRLACMGLVDGTITKLQVRYEWQASRWIDTLQRTDTGIRLVRMQQV